MTGRLMKTGHWFGASETSTIRTSAAAVTRGGAHRERRKAVAKAP